MQDFTIDVTKVEELQMTSDVQELDVIFQKAKSTLVNGALVHLGRKNKQGKMVVFEHITTIPDLSAYHDTVYKYLQAD